MKKTLWLKKNSYKINYSKILVERETKYHFFPVPGPPKEDIQNSDVYVLKDILKKKMMSK